MYNVVILSVMIVQIPGLQKYVQINIKQNGFPIKINVLNVKYLIEGIIVLNVLTIIVIFAKILILKKNSVLIIIILFNEVFDQHVLNVGKFSQEWVVVVVYITSAINVFDF